MSGAQELLGLSHCMICCGENSLCLPLCPGIQGVNCLNQVATCVVQPEDCHKRDDIVTK